MRSSVAFIKGCKFGPLQLLRSTRQITAIPKQATRAIAMVLRNYCCEKGRPPILFMEFASLFTPTIVNCCPCGQNNANTYISTHARSEDTAQRLLSHLEFLHGSAASMLALEVIRQLHVQIPRIALIGHALERACNHSTLISCSNSAPSSLHCRGSFWQELQRQ